MIDNKLPYHTIPDYPNEVNSANVMARMIDGLGYRYYWATEALRLEDLSYLPGGNGKSCAEQLDHIYDLSATIYNVTHGRPNIRGSSVERPEMTFHQIRENTLINLENASKVLKSMSSEEFEAMIIIFQRGDTKTEFPFWNLLNGQIADALYHVGQVVSYRRSSGNPISSKVNVFLGRNRD